MSAVMNIAIAGLGTVGCSTVSLLQEHAALYEKRTGKVLNIVAVSARDQSKDRGIDLNGIEWASSPLDLIQSDADIIVELIGGSDGAAFDLVSAALDAQKHVVTANKALIAKHGVMLAAKAEKANVSLTFEAAVAGGIPIIHALQHGLHANHAERIIGILNGTCNYILTTMQKTGREFADVLKEAQELGYAEADPTFDIDGIDTAHKLTILAALAYGTEVNMDAVHCEGIRHITATDIAYATELGYTIKLLGITQQHGDALEQRVHPCLIPSNAPIALIDGAFNAVEVVGCAVGRVLFEGQGAGGDPTASAVISDILDITQGQKNHPFNVPHARLSKASVMAMDTLSCQYYLRLPVADEPGVLADITSCLAKEKVSVERFVQKTHGDDQPAELVLTTHVTQEASMQAALSQIKSLSSVRGDAQLIRMLS